MTAHGERLSSLLRQLEDIWIEHDPEIRTRLADGLPVSGSQEYAAAVGLTFPEELTVWWQWHNGARAGEGMVRVGATPFDFLSLPQALEQYKFQKRAALDFAAEMRVSVQEAGWDEGWFPICQSESGGLVTADCCGSDGIGTPIRLVTREDDNATAVDADSLMALVQIWIDAHRSGIYLWSGTEWICRWDAVPPELRRTKLI